MSAPATTPWTHQLRRVTIVAPTCGRFPRRNPRDPRLKSYRPSSPTQYRGVPVEIPLEYSPVLDAKAPIRKLGTERSTRVKVHSFFYNKSKSRLKQTRVKLTFTLNKSFIKKLKRIASYSVINKLLLITRKYLRKLNLTLQASRAAPDMKRILAEMSAIHATPVPNKKTAAKT